MDRVSDVETTDNVIDTDSNVNTFQTETLLSLIMAAVGITFFLSSLIMIVICWIVWHCK